LERAPTGADRSPYSRNAAEQEAMMATQKTGSRAQARLEEAEGRERQSTLKTIEHELKVHTKIEEDIFYPAFRDAAEKEEDKELYFEALEEHHVVDLVLP